MIGWGEIAGLVVGTITAASASVGVYFLFMDRLNRISATFDHEIRERVEGGKPYDPASRTVTAVELVVTATVQNDSNKPVRIVSMEASGMPLKFVDAYDPEAVKRLDNGGLQRSADVIVQVGKSADLNFCLEPDWKSIQEGGDQCSSPSKSSGAFVLDVSIIILRRSWAVRRLSRVDSIAVNAETAMKNPAIVSHTS